jgi:hypothetical protein
MAFLASLGKMIATAVLLIISVARLLSFLYISFKTLSPRQSYKETKKYAIVGGVCMFLSCLGLSAVFLIWQPVLELAPILVVISLVAGGLIAQSIISPVWLANFWRKRAKRKDG